MESLSLVLPIPGNRFVSFVSCVRASERRRTQVCHAENKENMRAVAFICYLCDQPSVLSLTLHFRLNFRLIVRLDLY